MSTFLFILTFLLMISAILHLTDWKQRHTCDHCFQHAAEHSQHLVKHVRGRDAKVCQTCFETHYCPECYIFGKFVSSQPVGPLPFRSCPSCANDALMLQRLAA